MSVHRPITPSTPRSPTRSRTPLSPRQLASPRSPVRTLSKPPLEELLASALSHHEKKPSRVAPDAHRPAVAGSDADILSPVPIAGKHRFLFESEEALKRNEREEELREQIRQLELLSPEAAKRKATAWARLNDGGDLQYAKMTRPLANPLWVVPPSSIDELADDEGDAWIQQAMKNQKRHFNDSLHPQLQVRLSALQGEFNTRNPEGLFLANIEEMGAGGMKERNYDPLHGNPVTRRATWSRQSFGSRNTSAATSRAASRATTPGSSSITAAKRASSADAKTRQSQSTQKNRPSNATSTLAESPKPTGREFELIPPVPQLSDKALVASVFDETIASSDEEDGQTDATTTDSSSAPMSDKFIPPPPLLFSGVSVTDSFTPPDMASTAIRLHDRSIIPHSLIAADQPKPAAPPPPAKVGVVIGGQVGSVALFKRSSIKQPRVSTASGETNPGAPSSSADASKPSRPTSVSWANPTPVGETAVSTLARKDTMEEQKQSPRTNNSNALAAHRPHTADPTSFQSRAPPTRAPSAATTTDGRFLDSGSATARTPSSSCPTTVGSKSARSSRPSSSTGYIIPSGLTSFGYTDRELTTSGETTLDRFCSGSSAQPLDIIARPAGNRNDSGGSSGLLNRGCAVRYRATPSDHHDLLSEKMADTLSTGMTKMLDVKIFRREVELLTNNKQVSNAALKSMLNEKSTSDRIALLRREAKHRKNLEAGSVGSVTQQLPTNGLTHRLYNTAPSARNSIPPRYTKLAGTNIEHINAPSFGEPESNPFRLDPSAASRELPYPRPASGPYLGPGAYYPNPDFTRPTAKEGYWYGPSHSNWIKRAELDKTNDGPGMHRPKYEELGTEVPPRGLVEIARGTSRGAWDFVGPHADMNNPPPLAYKTGEKHWSEIVKSRHTNFGFGVSKRFDDRAYKLPSGSKDYINPHPERMLVLAGPRDGPGALHEIIPSRTGANSTYDPNVDAYLHSRGIPPIEVCAQYLSPEELSGAVTEGGAEDGAGSTATAPTHSAFVPLTRAQEREARELDDLLSGALAGAKIEQAHAAKPVTFVPISLPASNTPATAIPEVPVIDPLTLPTAEPPTLSEQRARAELFNSPLTQRTIRTVEAIPTKDFQEHNKQLVRAHSPSSKRVTLRSKAKSNKQRRLLVIERGKKTLNQRVSRMRDKIAADDEALAARTSGGLFNNRWMLLAALCARTSYIHRCLEFAKRMRSESHKQERAQRVIARAWRKHHERRMLIRRKAAALTLAKVFGTFRVRIRIKRKQKAANMLRAFFRTIAAANFLPPLSVNLKQLGQLSQSNTESANQTMINLRKKAQERQALVAKMKMRTGGDRTLVGLIRHFKSQVIVLQRAWRNYIRMREYSVDLHVLLWDSIAASHFSEVYNKMHHHEVTAASQPKAMSAAAQAANMFALSTMNKAPEKSRTFRAQQKVLESAKERDAKQKADAALDAKQADRFGAVPNPATKKSKVKPLALKMDARFTHVEKRQIILDALKQRKLRFLRVKRHYLQLMQRYVADQSTGISAARRLLVSDESKFTTAYFQRLFQRAHPPPHLPRIIAHRQMIQLMNAASLARKETRTSRYNMAATNLAAALNGASAKSSPQGTPPSSPAAPSRSRAQTMKGYQGREFDLTESRLRESLLKAWAAQLPIPTRPVQLTAEEETEEKQKRDYEEQENRRRVISFAPESDTDDEDETE